MVGRWLSRTLFSWTAASFIVVRTSALLFKRFSSSLNKNFEQISYVITWKAMLIGNILSDSRQVEILDMLQWIKMNIHDGNLKQHGAWLEQSMIAACCCYRRATVFQSLQTEQTAIPKSEGKPITLNFGGLALFAIIHQNGIKWEITR